MAPIRRLDRCGAVTVWALRLAIHLHLRTRHRGEDPVTCACVKDGATVGGGGSFVQVFLLQGIIMLAVAAPSPVAGCIRSGRARSGRPDVGRRRPALCRRPAHRSRVRRTVAPVQGWWAGQLLTTGLFALVRHPNHLGEAMVWWGLGLAAIATSGWGVWPVLFALAAQPALAMGLRRTHVRSRFGGAPRFCRMGRHHAGDVAVAASTNASVWNTPSRSEDESPPRGDGLLSLALKWCGSGGESMRCPSCGKMVCRYGDNCRFGYHCLYCHCNLDREEMRTALEAGLERAKLGNDAREIKFKLLDLTQWYEKNNPRAFNKLEPLYQQLLHLSRQMEDTRGASINLQKLIDLHERHSPDDIEMVWDLLSEQLEVNKNGDDIRSQGMTLQRMIRWLEDNRGGNNIQIWDMLNELLKLNRLEKNHRMQAKTLQRMINWTEIHRPENHDALWNLIEELLHIELLNENSKGVSMVLQRMINWVEANDADNGNRLWDLLERKLKVEIDSENDVGISMVISRKINWVEDYDPENKDLLWTLIQEQYKQNKQMEHAEGQGWALQKMIDWYEIHGVDDPGELWSVLELKLAQETEGNNLRGQAMVHQRMINWVEMNEPHNTQRLWGLLTSQLDLKFEPPTPQDKVWLYAGCGIWMKQTV